MENINDWMKLPPLEVNAPEDPSILQGAKDTGMAFTLIALLIGLKTAHLAAYLSATGILVLAMAAPGLFRKPARAWLGLSVLMGRIASRLLMSILYFVIVVPMGMIRRFMGSDPLRTQEWKRSTKSAFRKGHGRFSARDLFQPF